MKFKKIIRAASEFIILSILAEKGKTHPYEIAQSLRDEVFDNQKILVSSLKYLNNIGNQILYTNKGIHSKQDTLDLIKKMRNPMIKQIANIIFEQSEKDESIIQDIEEFVADSRNILQKKEEEMKIWESHQAIYQVMNNLEQRGLIQEAGTDIAKGRERKLYRITENGKQEAIAMLSLFGQLNQAIIPRAKIFSNQIDKLLEEHVEIVFRILNKIYSNDFLVKMIDNLNQESIIGFEDLFPLIKNDSFLIPLLLEDNSFFNLSGEKNLDHFQKSLFKKILKEKLRKYRESLDAIILAID